VSAELLPDRLEQRRGHDGLAPVLAEEPDHPAGRLQPGHIAVEIQPVQAGDVQRDMPGHHVRRGHHPRTPPRPPATLQLDPPQTRRYRLRMNPRSVPRGQNHETRRSEAEPLWKRLHLQLNSISFSRTATMTASILEWICSFSRMLRTWFFTVFSEMNSSLAMSRLFIPRATSLSTCISRSVSRGAGTSWARSSSSRRARAANSVRSLRAMDGLIRDWPPCAARTVSATSSSGMSLSR